MAVHEKALPRAEDKHDCHQMDREDPGPDDMSEMTRSLMQMEVNRQQYFPETAPPPASPVSAAAPVSPAIPAAARLQSPLRIDFKEMLRQMSDHTLNRMQSGATMADAQRGLLPVSSPGAAAPATPATTKKPPAASAAAANAVPAFLLNRDLHGLEPALTVRTRMLLACHSMNQMKMGLDIAKSFESAGYFPRQRFPCLTCLFCCAFTSSAGQRN